MLIYGAEGNEVKLAQALREVFLVETHQEADVVNIVKARAHASNRKQVVLKIDSNQFCLGK